MKPASDCAAMIRVLRIWWNQIRITSSGGTAPRCTARFSPANWFVLSTVALASPNSSSSHSSTRELRPSDPPMLSMLPHREALYRDHCVATCLAVAMRLLRASAIDFCTEPTWSDTE